MYDPVFYGVQKDTGTLSYDNIMDIAQKEKPKMIIAGASAYSRDINFRKFREIADSVGAFLLADISHPSGLIAKGILSDPIPHCHVVTTTTHKTLRSIPNEHSRDNRSDACFFEIRWSSRWRC